METSILKTTCPPDSQLRNYMERIDFEDAYAFRAAGMALPMTEIYSSIFTTAPPWVTYAMRLRNVLVSPLGLKTGTGKKQPICIKEGEMAGIFRIYKILDHEVIAGENDRHLNFRVSVHRNLKNNSTITVTTIVQYNNYFGKLYMTLISPIHKMVVKSILKSAVKRIEKDAGRAEHTNIVLFN